MGNPGWPLFDLLTASTASMRMLLMQRVSREVVAATILLRGDLGILKDGRGRDGLDHLAEGKADVVTAKSKGI